MKKSMRTFCVTVMLLLVACASGSDEQSLYYGASLMAEVLQEDEYEEPCEIPQYVPIYDEVSPDEVQNNYDDVETLLEGYESYVPPRPPEPQMSPLGIQVVEDFLMQFPAMSSSRRYDEYFSLEERVNTRVYLTVPEQLGRETYDGRFIVWDNYLRQSVYSDERLFHIGWQFGEIIYDANRRRIIEREQIITSEIPDIFIRYRFIEEGWHDGGFIYDSNLNRIESANWILNGGQYATHFTLWDFDNSGIPVIEIHYHGNSFAGRVTRSLFRFDGNEFRRISYHWILVFRPQYTARIIDYPFFDPDGN